MTLEQQLEFDFYMKGPAMEKKNPPGSAALTGAAEKGLRKVPRYTPEAEVIKKDGTYLYPAQKFVDDVNKHEQEAVNAAVDKSIREQDKIKSAQDLFDARKDPKHPEHNLAKSVVDSVAKDFAPATQAKYNKPPLYQGVIARFPRALTEVAKVSQFGTKKHQVPLNDMSYLDIPDAYNMYSDAVIRHLIAEKMHGPINKADGDLLHAAQCAWDALARLEVYIRDRDHEVAELFRIRDECSW